jgi:hypothetical protein
MVFGTVTKLIQSNQNITIGSKNVNWVRSFRFWTESVHYFVSGPIGALKQPRHGFRHSNENDPNEPKYHYWVQKRGLAAFVHFWTELVHHFVSGTNRCIKATPAWFSAQ